MAGSAGGSTAYADVPDYLENIHDNWLSGATRKYKEIDGEWVWVFDEDPTWLDDDKSVVSLLSQKIGSSSTNPYGGDSDLKDPSDIHQNLVNQYNFINNLANSLVTGDLVSIMQEAQNNVSGAIGALVGRSIDGEVDGILNDSLQHVSSVIQSTLRSTIGDRQISLSANVDARVKDAVKNNIGIFVQEAMDNITSTLATGSLDDATSVINQATEKTKALVQSVLNAAMQSVYDIVNSQIVADMVDSFDDSSRTRYNRDVGKWSAAMSKAGAAHTSAFVLGKAMFEIERLKSVDDYEAKIKMAVMDKALSIAGTSSSTVYGALVEAFKVTHAERLARFQTVLSETIKYYLTMYASTMDAIKAELANAYVLHGNVTQHWVNDYYKLYMQHKDVINRSIMAYVQARLNNDSNVMRHREWVAQFFNEIEKFDYLTNREWVLTKYDVAVKQSLWDFEVFQKAANVLASVSGATAVGSETIPARPSVIGGALSGAAIGASIPGAGVIGATIGALLGGTAAAFDK